MLASEPVYTEVCLRSYAPWRRPLNSRAVVDPKHILSGQPGVDLKHILSGQAGVHVDIIPVVILKYARRLE